MRIEKINKLLEDGYLEEAKQGLKALYLQQDKAEFESKLRAEYDELYPEYRYMTDEECKEWFTENVLSDEKEDYLPKVQVDYSQDENYKTFEEYKNETRIVTEASYVCDECQLALDSDKCINNAEHVTRLVPEVTELVRPYVPSDVSDKVDAYIKSKYAELRKNEYPAIEEQLDMLFKADWDGWRNIIRSIKEKYPKPDEEQ